MPYLFEPGDSLNTPVECFLFDTTKEQFPVHPHWHYYMELIYLFQGHALMHKDADVHQLSPGEMILFPPKSVHSVFSADGQPLLYAACKLDISRIHLTTAYSPKLRSIFRYAEEMQASVVFTDTQATTIQAREIFLRCIEEQKKQAYGFDLVIRSELGKLLIGMLRCWQENGLMIDSSVYARDAQYDIYSITEYIDGNLNRSLKVSEIAAFCGMSYSYFAKRFLSVYGKTCKEYMEQMRIYKVEEFLTFTDFSLSYISQETGFSDCSHMIRSFQRAKKMTPGQFRRHRVL